jgi:serine/threonine protein kinase
MLIQEKLPYLIADGEFYEPLSRYSPARKDFYEPLARILPADWHLEQRNLWYDCSYPEAKPPAQGWKIHLAAVLANAPAILVTAARILTAARVPFKFIADRSLLLLVNGKRWQRGSAGKFITVYPADTAQCGELLEALYRAMIGYQGPYILSDRRYRDSRVVHYRYGGILPTKRAGVDGRAVYIISDGEGGYVDDERTPFFKLPEGMDDPFLRPEVSAKDEGEAGTLKNGRYEIQAVLAFANPGGVYRAFDRETSEKVVIKEARPFTNVSVRGLDAIRLLKKEHRLLEVIADTALAPRPIDFFLDWEHAYMVEEYLEESLDLRGYLTGLSLALRTRADADYSREFYRKYCSTFRRLAEMVGKLHERNIIFSDLSFLNVMVLGGNGSDLRLIDFEGAYEEGVDIPTHLFTPGFTPEDAVDRGMAQRADDYYALGGLLLAGLFPMNALLVLNRRAHEHFLQAYRDDFDLPAPIADLICRLLDGNGERRPDPDEIIKVLGGDYHPAPPAVGTRELANVDLGNLTERILTYIDSVADFERSDRLYPADPSVFETNPLSLGYGACGVAYVMHRIRGRVDDAVLHWIRARKIQREACSPGLYIGLAGIAWSLLEIGLEDEAKEILGYTQNHHLLWRSTDLFYGVAGWGMTHLRFFLATKDEAHLDEARKAGRFLLNTREVDQENKGRCFWKSQEGVSAGLAHGTAGISLFLLYLHLATGDEELLSVGRQGIEWVAGRGVRNPDGGLTWLANNAAPTYTPYWRWGSSGIGRVLLRYWHLTGEERFANSIDHIHIDCDRKYAIFPGYFFGLAGIGELYLDMARFPRWEEIAMASARKLLAGCMLFRLDREAGLAFPGESLSRISCDFGTGSAGIALVMHRYRTRCGPSFMLDEMIPDWSPDDRPAEASASLD